MLINLFITNRCNYKCDYCYEKGMTSGSSDFLEEDIPQLISFIRYHTPENKRLWINFHGGEPLLNYPVIVKIVEASILERSCIFSLTTNMSLFNEEMSVFFQKHHFYISVSLDGTKDVHCLHRKSKTDTDFYEHIIAKIKRFSDINDPFRCRMTVTPSTVERLEESIRFIIALGGRTIVTAPDYQSGQWDAVKIAEFKKQIQAGMDYIETNDLDVTLSHPIKNSKIGICRGGLTEIAVNTSGEIFPCTFVCNDSHYRIGNLNKGIDRHLLADIEMIQQKVKKSCKICDFHRNCLAERCIYMNKDSVNEVFCEFRKAFV